ncbi:hypothetical protein CYK24_03425 [Trueperella bernardiae]|uniref:hypothetical protein n=1 Tax=Trueperella bernardiae TaxID=59561 RepID=UPI000C7B089F|nr:hypothetical protein [Trueperella bernardiae]PKZ89355.1 hypothetical protein CYK24_03425 [Trueperella bernardiae]
MEIDIFWLVAAFGGGAFGAAIGGQTAFIFTGLMYLIGLGVYMAGMDASPYMDSVVFGPVFGPHIAFAGGATAAAYAAWKGAMPKGTNGRDIVTPLAGLGRSDILVVGGVTGMIGYILNLAIAQVLPTLRTDPLLHYGNEALGSTDTVALTIIIIAIVTRFVFGKTGIFNKVNGLGLLEVGEGKHWVEHQEKWSVTATHGLTSGLLSAFGTLVVVQHFFEVSGGAIANHAQLLGWAISAVTLIFLTCGLPTPVTHHMTILASIAALRFMPIIAGTSDPAMWTAGNLALACIIGGIFGILGGLLGEILARMTNSNGDTHIDPPAFAIWIGTTLIHVTAVIM